MVPSEFNQFHKEVTGRCLEICQMKQKDYAQEGDVFTNFRNTENLGLTTTEIGMLVRGSDKYARICNIVAKGGQTAVTDESVDDTIMDLINYMIIVLAYLTSQRGGENVNRWQKSLGPQCERLHDPVPKTECLTEANLGRRITEHRERVS